MRLTLQASAVLALGAALSVHVASAQVAPRPREGQIRVLFIGNSYIYVNNLPELVRGLAAGMTSPVQVETEQVTLGGATLRQLWEAGPALVAIRRAGWDYVVLQEQSTLGATLVNGQSVVTDPNRLFWPYVRLFDREIKNHGGRTVLLETWGQRGEARNFDALAHAYFTIGKELNAVVIPAGLAWQRALAERGELPLYMADGSHPAPVGSYLLGLATLATLLDRVPDAAPLSIRGHATGLDGRPADSLGTLASIDSATFQLFRRVVVEVRREITRAGGYLSVRRPAMPAARPIPPGRPIPSGALAGTWKGTLQLFNVPGGQPLTVEIRIGSGGDPYIGTAVIELDAPIREDPLDVTIDGQEVRFSIRSPIDQDVRIQFQGVLTADDRLEGRASIVSEERGWDFTGAWSATRR